MKTNSFLTTDYTDEEPAFSYPCHPCYPRLKFFLLQLMICLFGSFAGCSAFAQVQQAWVAKYNNGIFNGTNQAVILSLDPTGNIYITGWSQNTNGNLDYATIKYAPSGTQVWAARYVAANTNSAITSGIALDPSNNVFITGNSATVKYDSKGNQVWTAPYAGTSVASDGAGNVYVTGFGTNFNTEKLSATGSNLWGTTYVDKGPTLSKIVMLDSQTNVYVAGADIFGYLIYNGVISSTYAQVAVIKYDVNGNQLWIGTYSIDNGGVPMIVGAALDNANNVYVSANWYLHPYQTTMFSNGGVVGWTASPSVGLASQSRGMALDHNDDVLVAGEVPYAFNGTYSYYYGTFKLSTNGSTVYSDYFPQPPYGPSVAAATTVDKANNVYVTGYSPGTNSGNDIVTIKYDNNGNQLWVQRYNGPGNGDDEANAIAVDASGNVYVTGYDTTAAGGTEMVTIKYAPSPTGSKQTNGSFLLQTQGEPGETFDIQATTNFTNWLDLGLTNADTNGHLQFLDTNAALYNQRFYTTKPQ